MKLATFNLYQFVAPPFYWYERDARNTYSTKEWQAKQAWISEQIHALGADLIGFQEVFSTDELQALTKHLGYPYFATVEAPKLDTHDSKVFIKPIVALASRLPLTQVATVTAHPDIQQTLPLSEAFHFSREPIVATLEHPQIGELCVYITHLKSKRPIMPKTEYDDQTPWAQRVQHTMQQLSSGNIASQFQRGAEASLLYHHISQQLKQKPDLPIIVMGDLNDDHDSIALSALTMQDKLYSIGGINDADWPEGVKGYIHDYRMSDSFRIAPNMKHRARPYSYIHRGQGQTLDHILVSNALNRHNPASKYHVSQLISILINGAAVINGITFGHSSLIMILAGCLLCMARFQLKNFIVNNAIVLSILFPAISLTHTY